MPDIDLKFIQLIFEHSLCLEPSWWARTKNRPSAREAILQSCGYY